MKTLRYLLIMSIVALAIPSFSQNVITNDEVFVTITGETSREELGTLRTQLQAVGIDFQYFPGFNSERMLMGIKIIVKADEAHTGTADNQMLSAPQQKIQFHMTKVDGAITTWCVGTCEEE